MNDARKYDSIILFFFFHRTNYMYVCQDPFHDTFPYQLHTTKVATRRFILSFCGHFFFFCLLPLSLFPCNLHTYMYVCIYVYIYIYITKVACRRISLHIATFTLLLHLSVVRTYVYT